jgi:hypothetical protein
MVQEFEKFLRETLVGKFTLHRVISFGDWGEAEDECLYIADTREELEGICQRNGWCLRDPSGWNEYFIRQVKP